MADPVHQRVKTLNKKLSRTLIKDRVRLAAELRRLGAGLGNPKKAGETNKRLEGLEKRLEAALARGAQRRRRIPKVSIPESLPIFAKRREIVEAIQNHRVVIVSGDTGSGKTTQLPKYCLQAGRGVGGWIGCTQPRRIAAVTVAGRIAEEMNEALGVSVGYKIRFKNAAPASCFIKIMTDGVLLAEAASDPYLNAYDTLIVDEAHERSLNIDFTLGLVKTLLDKRNDLKLIVTSATIDTEKFSKAFDDAPVVEVSGRMYPVEVRYMPPENGQEDDASYVDRAVAAVETIHKKDPMGDVLVFMPTEQDIRDTKEMLEGRRLKNVTVIPLFARLSGKDQKRAFAQFAGRKVIVATNVAETSLTIPGIKYVVDTGLARISRYSPRSRTTALPISPISKSSADQRKGRCGRVENGVCIRLFSREDFDQRPLYTPPEIVRANLAEVILRMISLNLGDVAAFPFIDKPAAKSIRDGFDLLTELSAVTFFPENKNRPYRLTEIGKWMAKMPIDPRLSRMLKAGLDYGCLDEVSVTAAALAISDPKERPADKTQAADRAHGVFSDPASDFTAQIRLWNAYHDAFAAGIQAGSPTKAARLFCQAHFLSMRRMREWRDIHQQLRQIMTESGGMDKKARPKRPGIPEPGDSDYAALHKSVLTGFLSNIAIRKEKNIYQATKGRTAMIFPGSCIFNKSGQWIVASEMVETSRLFARTAANIQSEWLEEVGKSHLKHAYSDPHWEKNQGRVMAKVQITLFGLTIAADRMAPYAKVNPEEAADIFIRSALVQGDVKKVYPFMKHNMALMDEAADLEHRFRSRDFFAGEDEMFAFYKAKLGSRFSDIRTFERFLREKGNNALLRMNKSDVLRRRPENDELALFPDRMKMGDKFFELSYRFDPGSQTDGVTVRIPSAFSTAVPASRLDWLVPGLFKEKVAALIKTLPKNLRKRLSPVADTVEVIHAEMPRTDEPLEAALSRFIHDRFSISIPAPAWDAESLPDHLKARVEVIGPDGKVVARGRGKSALGAGAGDKGTPTGLSGYESLKKKWEKDKITRWDFEDLPKELVLHGNTEAGWAVYPALEDMGDHARLRLFSDKARARAVHEKGVVRLFCIRFSNDLKYVKKIMRLPHETVRRASGLGTPAQLEAMLFDRLVAELFGSGPKTREQFEALAQKAAPEIIRTAETLLENTARVLDAYAQAAEELSGLWRANTGNKAVAGFLDQRKTDLANLVPPHFIELYQAGRLAHLPRYIRAISLRAGRGAVDLEKDREKAEILSVCTGYLDILVKDLNERSTPEKRRETESFFWLVEEFKVSLFAQELKTAVPVSQKRLKKAFESIQRMM